MYDKIDLYNAQIEQVKVLQTIKDGYVKTMNYNAKKGNVIIQNMYLLKIECVEECIKAITPIKLSIFE